MKVDIHSECGQRRETNDGVDGDVRSESKGDKDGGVIGRTIRCTVTNDSGKQSMGRGIKAVRVRYSTFKLDRFERV